MSLPTLWRVRRGRDDAPVKRPRRSAFVVYAILGAIAVLALAAPFLPVPEPNRQDLGAALIPPLGFGGSLEHPLGTDHLGRDVLSRMLFGARLSILIAVTGVLLAGLVGTALGILSGYARGVADFVISRLVEAQLALPFMLLAVALIVSRGQSLLMLVLVLAVYGWAEYARILRSEVLSLRERPYVMSLRIAGVSSAGIMARHIVPNVINTVIVIATLQVGFMVLGESALSFIGLGVTAPDVSWGLMLADGRSFITAAWWLVSFPGIAIFLFVLCVILAGDDLRRRFDPRRRVYRG
jgi:peptide/nickel transport system permease protein